METEKIRIDKYLWAIRIVKSRAIAAEACEKSKVKINDVAVKASKTVHIGDVIWIKTEARIWLIKVLGLIEKRVSYPEAILQYEDITPVELKDNNNFQPSSFHTGKRLSKIGRPTKKDRRDIDSLGL